MKFSIFKLIPILLVFLASCSTAPEEGEDSETSGTEVSETEESDVENSATLELDSKVAVDFVNSYIDNWNKMSKAVEMVKWTEASPLATLNLKNALKKMVADANKEDPEMGLGFDPLLDAQDYPDEGVVLASFDKETGVALLKGVNWDTYEVAVKLVVENDKVMVDGCGVVNMPKNLRATR